MSSGATQVNLGDIFATLIIAGLLIIIPVVLAIFFITYKKNAKKQSMENQQITALEKQVAELQKRIGELEK